MIIQLLIRLLLLTFIIQNMNTKEFQSQEDQNQSSEENFSDADNSRPSPDDYNTSKRDGNFNTDLYRKDSRSLNNNKTSEKQIRYNKNHLSGNGKLSQTDGRKKTKRFLGRRKSIKSHVANEKPNNHSNVLKPSLHKLKPSTPQENISKSGLVIQAMYKYPSNDLKNKEDEEDTSENNDRDVEPSRKAKHLNNDTKSNFHQQNTIEHDERESESIADEQNTFKDNDVKPSPDKKKIPKHYTKNTRPILNEQKTIEHSGPFMYERNTSENRYKNAKLNLYKRKISKSHSEDSSIILDNEKSGRHLNEYRRLGHNERTMVTGNEFTYMVAVLKGAAYVCAGALIDENWVLTAADNLNLMRDSTRFLRVRLGSINYKKGGILLPVKYLEIHPYFDSSKPEYDLALIMLSKSVRYTSKLRAIRLQLTPKEVTATHCIVTSWPEAVKPFSNHTQSDTINRHLMSVSHPHPADPEDCAEELNEAEAGHDGIMCLETGKDTCARDVGAPVVINGVLYAIISSWNLVGCDEENPAMIFATAVSARNISSWIHATVHEHQWRPNHIYHQY